MNKKDPAFLFYPNDWIGGTMGMNFEEKGAYVELLMMQFNRGHMTKHMIERTVGQLWVKIEDKFVVDKNGLYYNARLDKEKSIRNQFVESRRNNVLGKNQYNKSGGHMTKHMIEDTTSHMEDEDVSIKRVFNTMPIFENFNGLPEIKIGASKELLKATQRIEATTEQINSLWNVFKVQNLNGETYYKSEDKVYSHFINWIKTQKLTNAGDSTKSKLGNKSGGFSILTDALNENK